MCPSGSSIKSRQPGTLVPHGHQQGSRSSTPAQLHTKSFGVPDQAFPVGDIVRVEVVQLGETTVHRATFQPGFRWTEHIKLLMGADLCAIPHVGYVLSGRLGVWMADGAERELAPGDAPSTLLDFPPEKASKSHG